MKPFLSEEEITRHREALLREMEDLEVELVCLFNRKNIFYLTGLYLMTLERPKALLFDGHRAVPFVPALEVGHVRKFGGFSDVISYPEYPGTEHPLKELGRAIGEFTDGRIGVDASGYGGGYGYRGPEVSEIVDNDVEFIEEQLTKLIQIKSDEEIELVRESARWSERAHEYLEEETYPGVRENVASVTASLRASLEMIEALGDDYYPVKGGDLPAAAGYRGQIGPDSAIPHLLTKNKVISGGDVVVTGAFADVGGYSAELERTMIVGEPTEEQRKYFDAMVRAGDLATDLIEPGRSFSRVDGVIYEFYRDNDLTDYWRHHTGHSIGLSGHEPPFFDRGDDRVLKPGMVVTVEPGIYVPDVGGFRHSDTLVVTEDGNEFLTRYPRSVDDLIID